jgi:hypothetical protein
MLLIFWSLLDRVVRHQENITMGVLDSRVCPLLPLGAGGEGKKQVEADFSFKIWLLILLCWLSLPRVYCSYDNVHIMIS